MACWAQSFICAYARSNLVKVRSRRADLSLDPDTGFRQLAPSLVECKFRQFL